MKTILFILSMMLAPLALANGNGHDNDDDNGGNIEVNVGIHNRAYLMQKQSQKQRQAQKQSQRAKTGDVNIDFGDDNGDTHAASTWTADACQTGVNGGGNGGFLGMTWTSRDCKRIRQSDYLGAHYGTHARIAHDCRYPKFRRTLEAVGYNCDIYYNPEAPFTPTP